MHQAQPAADGLDDEMVRVPRTSRISPKSRQILAYIAATNGCGQQGSSTPEQIIEEVGDGADFIVGLLLRQGCVIHPVDQPETLVLTPKGVALLRVMERVQSSDAGAVADQAT